MKPLTTISQWEVFKNRKQILDNPLPFHNENFEKYGDTFKVNIGPRSKVVFTRDPEIIQQVLQKQHKKFHKSPLQTRDLAKYIGHGLLTSEGEHWRKHRRMIQPAFHKKKLEGLLGIMQEAIVDELKGIQPNTDQDVFPLMGDLAFRVVAKSLFGRSDIRQKMKVLQHITEANQKMLIKEMRQPYLKWWFSLSGQLRKHLKLSEQSRELLNELIDERVASTNDNSDLLDMLLNATYEDGTHMPRRQLIDEVLILFTAGHETTANVLSFTLYLLACHPTIQEKVFQEVSEADIHTSDPMNWLSKLTFTQHCIEEAMRLYPSVYVIDRIAIKEASLGPYNFPKDTLLLMSIYELHRHKNFWEDPGTFKPERFELNSKKEMGSYYYPFGAGPRMCVGNNFAMYEMIMTIAHSIKKYQIRSVTTTVELNPLISLKPKEVLLNFKERERIE